MAEAEIVSFNDFTSSGSWLMGRAPCNLQAQYYVALMNLRSGARLPGFFNEVLQPSS